MRDLNDLEKFLHREIPLSRAMKMAVTRADERETILKFPLSPNINHLGTAFGGSLNTAALLACYTWLYATLQRHGSAAHVLVKASDIRYLRPVRGAFTSRCDSPLNTDIEKFFKTLTKKNMAQLKLSSRIYYGNVLACEFEGDFYAAI